MMFEKLIRLFSLLVTSTVINISYFYLHISFPFMLHSRFVSPIFSFLLGFFQAYLDSLALCTYTMPMYF